MLTANYEYSHSNTENVLPLVQIQLSEKLAAFSQFFIPFPKYALNFEELEKKMSLMAQICLKLLIPKDVFT